MKKKSTESITFSVDEIATMLRESKWKVRKMLREGQIGGRRVGKSWVVTVDDLQQYMKVHHG